MEVCISLFKLFISNNINKNIIRINYRHNIYVECYNYTVVYAKRRLINFKFSFMLKSSFISSVLMKYFNCRNRRISSKAGTYSSCIY